MYDEQKEDTCCSADTHFKHSRITMMELRERCCRVWEAESASAASLEAASAMVATQNAVVAEKAAAAEEAAKLETAEAVEHLRSAINAYTKGHRPSEFAHEWAGSIVSLIPKNPAAMMMTDERPIACECSKYIIATTIYNDRLSRVMEDFQLLDDA